MNRITQLDFARGLCVFSVIFIHTTFWSGGAYVPHYIQQLSLLLDVPAFFFISGMTACLVKKSSLSKNLIFFIVAYVLIGLLYGLLFEFTVSPRSMVESFLLVTPQTPKLPVITGSLWFVNVFLVTVIYSQILIHLSKKFIALYLSLIVVYFFLLFFGYIGSLQDLSSFSVNINYLLNYTFFYLLGYMIWDIKDVGKVKRILVFLSMISFVLLLLLYLWHGKIVLDLQSNKFLPKLPYFLASIPSCALLYFIVRSKLRSLFLEYMGKNAFHFYISQGISSSLLLYMQPYVVLPFYLKLPLLFLVNIILASFFAFLIIFFHKKVVLIYNKRGALLSER